MNKRWCEPKLDDLLSDPILDVLLAHDRITRDDLGRVIAEARQTLVRVPREWHVPDSTDKGCPRRPDPDRATLPPLQS